MNILAILTSAIIPLIIGFIWYNPKVLGNAWMKASGLTEDKLKTGNLFLIFLLTFILSFLFAAVMQMLVIHQLHVGSMLFKQPFQDPSTPVGALYKELMENYGTGYRTFKHGAFHGFFAGLFLATPIIAITSMFERKGFKYIAIHAGYWIICMLLMGGVLSAWA